MAALGREGLMAALALRSEDVTLKGGGVVRVRTMTAGERIALGTSCVGEDGKIESGKFSSRLVAACVVDENGARIFSDEDSAALLGGASDVFEAIFAASQRINGMGIDAVEAAKGN